MIKGRPFVKWAGGKRQIMNKLMEYVPDEFDTYYEPFVGGGALLFELSPKRAVINDSNYELMNVYNCIKDEKKFEAMCRELNRHEMYHSEDYYYEIRNIDRDKKKFNKIADYKRAARTIYLNKACFNGLYRVNSKGEFNVPFGKKAKVNTYEGQNLGIVFREWSDRGCFVMLSNHNTKLINVIYGDFIIHVIEAKRNINANGKKRGKVEEVIITNFENKRGFDNLI